MYIKIIYKYNNDYLLDVVKSSINQQPLKSGDVFANILTPREKEILQYIVRGKLNKEIAYFLKISLSTVEIHRSRIMHKLKAKNVAHLIKVYLEKSHEAQ